MSTYTDELNVLLKNGFSYDSVEVQTLQDKFLKGMEPAPPKPAVYARVARSQEEQRQLAHHMKRQKETEAEQDLFDKLNK